MFKRKFKNLEKPLDILSNQCIIDNIRKQTIAQESEETQ
nr:MAG TPA: hypothetical protein [Caudoviricetes sp.]